MNNPLISVIVPVYNVERYLDRCISSIVNQTYGNLEIILVDDGSSDGSSQISDEWGCKDTRIRVIHKKNEGLSSARNAGIEESQGEYICFVDSDDWIEMDMVKIMLEACEKHGALLASCGRYITSGDDREVDKCYPKDGVVDSKQFVSQMFIGKNCDSAAWDKIYHRSLWDNVRYPYGRIYEDIATTYKLVLKTDQVAVIGKPLYNYYRHINSITAREFSSQLLDYPHNTRELIGDISNRYPELYEYVCWSHIKAIEHVLRKIAKTDHETYKANKLEFGKLSRELAEFKNIWNRSELFNRRDKMLYALFSKRFLIRPICKIKGILNKFKI